MSFRILLLLYAALIAGYLGAASVYLANCDSSLELCEAINILALQPFDLVSSAIPVVAQYDEYLRAHVLPHRHRMVMNAFALNWIASSCLLMLSMFVGWKYRHLIWGSKLAWYAEDTRVCIHIFWLIVSMNILYSVIPEFFGSYYFPVDHSSFELRRFPGQSWLHNSPSVFFRELMGLVVLLHGATLACVAMIWETRIIGGLLARRRKRT